MTWINPGRSQHARNCQSSHYRIDSYIVDELYGVVTQSLPIDAGRIGIFGHSMGRHGALTPALRKPDEFRPVSAFAPIAAPTRCPWGEKAFAGYLGADRETWRQYDASELMAKAGQVGFPGGIV
ncbi:hypothetical protein PanNE5_40520 [Pandoraea sp. NE5]|nr:hypothetical protein PanNE5_40520 [Pandoraea sp. NE5]